MDSSHSCKPAYPTFLNGGKAAIENMSTFGIEWLFRSRSFSPYQHQICEIFFRKHIFILLKMPIDKRPGQDTRAGQGGERWTLPLPANNTLHLSQIKNTFVSNCKMDSTRPRTRCRFDHAGIVHFLASPDAQEVMWVSESVSESFRVSRLDWCDPGEWWYL